MSDARAATCSRGSKLLFRVADRVAGLAADVFHLPLSSSLQGALQQVTATLESDWVPDFTGASIVSAVCSEVARISRQGRLTLLIDGLEKVPHGSESLDLFETLASIRDEVELVVVIPWHAAFGPQAETVIRPGERFVAVRALDVQGEVGEPGSEVLRNILLQRLGWRPEALAPESVAHALSRSLDEERERVAAKRNLVNDAIHWSGGLPRVFLQLLAERRLVRETAAVRSVADYRGLERRVRRSDRQLSPTAPARRRRRDPRGSRHQRK